MRTFLSSAFRFVNRRVHRGLSVVKDCLGPSLSSIAVLIRDWIKIMLLGSTEDGKQQGRANRLQRTELVKEAFLH